MCSDYIAVSFWSRLKIQFFLFLLWAYSLNETARCNGGRGKKTDVLKINFNAPFITRRRRARHYRERDSISKTCLPHLPKRLSKKKIVRFKENTNFRGHPVTEPSRAHVHNTSLNRYASQSRQTRLFRLTFESATIAGPLVSCFSFS